MIRALAVSVRLHDGRYHGQPDWPPSPARLFQALIAGAAAGGTLSDADTSALAWFESLDPPVIGAPNSREGQPLTTYVPNNDLDAVGGDPAKIGELRAPKFVKPRLFNTNSVLFYVWRLESTEQSEVHARSICKISMHLYQLGRGVDMACAWGEVLDETEAGHRVSSYVGVVYRPGIASAGAALACPQIGSLDSLIVRHAAQRHRFITGDKANTQVFVQPPKPRFQQILYNSPATLLLYDLIDQSGSSASRLLAKSGELVGWVRDKAIEQLTKALPQRSKEFERMLIGRGAAAIDKESRIQILALPSIGYIHADRAIRRILVIVPPNCTIARDDVSWAFSGLALQIDHETGEIRLGLVNAKDRGMLRHYGVECEAVTRRWRTVTPAALPWVHTRHRIDRSRIRTEGKSGEDRSADQARAMDAVHQALRHAGVRGSVEKMRIQREPFEANGSMSAVFSRGTRFAKERLWHVEVEFKESVSGPLAIGDGRYLGLGLMHPVPATEQITGIYCFNIMDGLQDSATEAQCALALRRAVMARVQGCLGPRQKSLPRFFSGHEPDGTPSNDPDHSHLAFVADLPRRRFVVVAPHLFQGRAASREEAAHLQTLDSALNGFRDLRAGASGYLHVVPEMLDVASDPLFRAACVWESVTEYRPARHQKRVPDADALVNDVRTELARRGLPAPEAIDVLKVLAGPRGGLAGTLKICFRVAVCGPVILGRTRHMGGGLFAAA